MAECPVTHDSVFSPGIFQGKDPLVYHLTQRLRTGSQEAVHTTPIAFAEYGIQNPATARVLVGLVEMGVITPEGLMTTLRAYQSLHSEALKNEEKVGLKSFFWTVTLDPEKMVNVKEKINLPPHEFSEVIVKGYPLTDLFSFLNDYTTLITQEKAISVLDAFFDMFAGGRMQLLHLAGKVFRRKMQEGEKGDGKVDSASVYRDSISEFRTTHGITSPQFQDFLHKFRTFEAACSKVGDIPQIDEQKIFDVFQEQIEIGFHNLAGIFTENEYHSSDVLIPAHRMHRWTRKVVYDVRTHQIIKDLHSQVKPYVLKLLTGEEVPLYKAGSCPFFMTGWEEI